MCRFRRASGILLKYFIINRIERKRNEKYSKSYKKIMVAL
jgi:hypothetical protein